MYRVPRFRKVEACVYEYDGPGYLLECMLDGTWEAYLPDANGYRLWQSVRHQTRNSAAMAISAERRRVAKRARCALN